MKNDFVEKTPKDYREYICNGITLVCIVFGFLFPNALPRLFESVRDLGTSIVFYFYGLLAEIPETCPIPATVLGRQEWSFAESRFEPFTFFPWTWEEFKILWSEYWALWFAWDNVCAYFMSMSDLLSGLSQILTIGLLLYIPIVFKSGMKADDDKKEVAETDLKENEKLYEDTKSLKLLKSFLFRYVYPVARWCRSFGIYVKENERFYRVWISLWMLYFNVISIGISFFAFYLYFITAWDFVSIYVQIVKLITDLTPAIRFIPGVFWIVIALIFLSWYARERGYSKLEHNERKNRGFLNERGVCTVIWGNMGTGKTRTLTSLALSAEKQLRDDALEILLETDMKFPNFPWCRLRAEVKQRMKDNKIVDVFSIRRWIREWKAEYLLLEDEGLLSWYQRNARKGKVKHDVTFGYDIEHYRVTYNDNLQIVHLYDAIMDYAQAYFVYSIQTSLIFSNYSIRVDFDVHDSGHFPLYNDDFFRRKPEFQDLYSKYCHIIDFDMLRLGERMIKDNPNKNALGFGVYVVSEIDKERKNELEIRKRAGSKRKRIAREDEEEECTQDNDLFNACLKMIRHATVIANRVFVKVLCDLQRPEDWGAGGREVGEVTFIESKGEKAPVLPFFSPYWFIQSCYFIHRLFVRFYLGFIKDSDDNTLPLFVFKNITAFYDQYIDRTEKLFGSQTFHLEVESGRMDGQPKKRKFYGMDKKDYSRRYSTDAMSSIFDLPNTVSIAMFVEYADIMATKAERDKQNSHFQKDIDRYIET